MDAVAELDRERAVVVGRDDVAHPGPQLAGRSRSSDVRLLVETLHVAGHDFGLKRKHLEQESQRVVGLRVGASRDVISSDRHQLTLRNTRSKSVT